MRSDKNNCDGCLFDGRCDSQRFYNFHDESKFVSDVKSHTKNLSEEVSPKDLMRIMTIIFAVIFVMTLPILVVGLDYPLLTVIRPLSLIGLLFCSAIMFLTKK